MVETERIEELKMIENDGNIRDTIVAIATPPGVGAIGIVRASGPDSWRILEDCVRKSIGIERKVRYGNFYDTEGNVIDEVLFVGFKAPRSYTAEDMVEVYCHGGVLVTQKILEEFVKRGC